MKISCNWLRNYLDLDKTPEELSEVLPLLGFDIESVVRLGPPPLEHVVVGQVLEFGQHPNADRLRVCKVRVKEGGAPLDIVCGAKNFEAGDCVLVALPGAVLPGDFKIKKSKLRGAPSEGMICSAKELNISDDHEGILVLDGQPALGTPVNALFTDSDTVLDLEVTPNRPDALCHIGVARELAARFGGELKYPEVKAASENPSSGEPLLDGVAIEAPEACSHYTALRIRGVKVGPSPDWLKQALEAVGLRPINNVVDVTNYVLHETCQPLHAFDAARIAGGRLVVRKAREGEKITTLDGKERTLDTGMAVVADAERALVVAGVMGSVAAEVDEGTTDVVLEAACFDPGSVRATSRRLGLASDSSYRFERGTDPQGVTYAVLRAADLILEVAGGTLDGDLLEAGAPPATVTEIELRPDAVRRFTGFAVSDETIIEVLESLELDVSVHDEPDGSKRWEVGVPSFRGDLERDVDLVEEFVRVYGTDKIPETPVVARGIGGEDHAIHTFNNAVARYLNGQSFDEALLYSLRDPEETWELFGEESFQILALANPLQSDQSHLRASLVPGLLDTLRLNHARGTGAIRFFERGRTFRAAGGKAAEQVSVAFVMLAGNPGRQWRQREPADFFTARTLCENLLELAGASARTLDFVPLAGEPLWQEGHAAFARDPGKGLFEIRAGLLDVGMVKQRWDIDQPVLAGSVTVEPGFFERPRRHPRHRAISGFPASGRDLALVVDRDVLAGRVRADLERFAAAAAESFACESVRVFDLYEGEGLTGGKKSLAFSLTFRAADRTLEDKEVNAVFERIQKSVTDETDYAIRK